MADKHMQILANLIKAVTNVADRGTSQESNIEGSEGSSSVSVEETIKRLFPSTEGGQGANATKNTVLGERAVEQERNENPDRHTVASIVRFNPSTVYRPKAGKRAKSSSSKAPKKSSSSKAQNQNHQRTKASEAERKSAKDVILLPGPNVNCVPKGVAREELYVRGFTTTFELTLSMTEEEIRCILEEKLKDKLCNIAGLNASDDESDDNASVKSPVHEPCTGPLHPPSPDISTTRLSSEPSTSATNEPSCSRNLIACPTCHNAFPAGEIELHADACAEEKYGSVNENQYNNIMEEFDDIYEIENTSHVETPTINVYDNDEIPNDDILTPENHKQKIKDAVYRLNKLVPDKQNKYHIRRKTIFDDYVNARVRSKWMQPENKIRVAFVGEKGIDGGGPKREFLSDVLKHVEMRLFDGKGMIIPSTVALTSGHFKYAGELMALSVVQGGPCPNFFSQQLYNLITKGINAIQITTDMIKDEKMRTVAEKIAQAQTNDELTNILSEDETLSLLSLVGYRGVPSRETLSSKENIVRSITVKAVIEPQLSMLSQLEEGMRMYGFLQEVKDNPELFRPVFVADASSMFDVSPDEFLSDVIVTYNERQVEKHAEEDTFKHFCDFVEFLFHAGPSEVDLSLSDLLKFVTGSFSIPPLGLGDQIEICFVHGCDKGCRCRPTASTCLLKLCLPVHLNSFDCMKDLLISSIQEGRGFGNF
ncbi:G2 M phase-specific E3 ubiquitin- ligase-like [Paramuricea clavata]|uniref:HECT-type E3 ubiquitin transferase n=1 Tax=Paramuricea clavata TaxID=317549 RepID=A0A6S7GML7_PARCT|nr:G2 M phase-specific E3 ubiquitin- ligase-like [Paramuricea clavata]